MANTASWQHCRKTNHVTFQTLKHEFTNSAGTGNIALSLFTAFGRHSSVGRPCSLSSVNTGVGKVKWNYVVSHISAYLFWRRLQLSKTCYIRHACEWTCHVKSRTFNNIFKVTFTDVGLYVGGGGAQYTYSFSRLNEQ